MVSVSPQPAAAFKVDNRRGVVGDIVQQLEDLGTGSAGSRSTTQGEPSLRIVDIVSATFVVEEVVLGGRVPFRSILLLLLHLRPSSNLTDWGLEK